jgi:nicotinate-nucleotide--dimethylbenzimidazole phosphoribosyltransferase
MTSGLPFDDIRNLAGQLPALNAAAAERARAELGDRSEALGRAGGMVAWFAGATGHVPARVSRPVVALFAATHALSLRLGVGDPVAEARARVEAVASGAAPVSPLCAAGNLGLNVFDLALELPVDDITAGPALDERAAAATMAFGMEAVATGADLVCLGTIGAAGDPSAMALMSALSGGDGREWAGEAGDSAGAIFHAIRTHREHCRDPLEAMRRLGGREIPALAGAILAARTQNVAVVLDGLAATAAAAVLHALNPHALAHCMLAAAVSPQHETVARRLGLEPILKLGPVSEGGIAGALAVGVVKSAGEISAGMSEVRRRRAAG